MTQDLLDDRSHHIEFNGHLTNHAKHAVVALRGLGADERRVRAYYDNYARLTPYGFPLEKPRPSARVITEQDWAELLGRRSSYGSYCVFFEGKVGELGLDAALRRYVPVLLPGWAGAFTHAAIHLGWALDASSRLMAVEGLAYMAFAYVDCRPRRLTRAGAGAGPLDSLLHAADAWHEGSLRRRVESVLADERPSREIHPELARSGLQLCIARLLASDEPFLGSVPPWLEEPVLPGTWEALYEAVALLYLAAPGDFILLHLLTSLYAMERIASMLPAAQAREAIRCYWIGLLAIAFSRPVDFPTRAALEALRDRHSGAVDPDDAGLWSGLVGRAILEEEEHNPKLVYVLRRLWGRGGRKTLYRAAAACFTTTPELPKSFEQPPID